MPHDVTPKQLETLLNGLLKQEEKLPYSFFVNEQQISDELGTHLLKNKVPSGFSRHAQIDPSIKRCAAGILHACSAVLLPSEAPLCTDCRQLV